MRHLLGWGCIHLLPAIHSYGIAHKSGGAEGVLHINKKRHDPTQPARSCKRYIRVDGSWHFQKSSVAPNRVSITHTDALKAFLYNIAYQNLEAVRCSFDTADASVRRSY